MNYFVLFLFFCAVFKELLYLIYNYILCSRYLVAAVGSLDYQKDVYKENMKLVLQKLEKNVKQYVKQFPDNAFAGKFKLLKGGVRNILDEDQF